jgi:transposase
MAAKVIIGVDPHKTTHTAVAVDDKERQVGKLEVRANASQLKRLLAWAEPFTDRTWAVEGSGGCGYLLAQQLVDAGEHVLDVPATLASRVRLLGNGKSNKNDPNDALSVAVAALRAPRLAPVRPADHATVLRILAVRNRQLGSSRTRTACRLHALLAQLVPGGSTKRIKANEAQEVLDAYQPATPAEAARRELALEHVADLRRLDDQLNESHKRLGAVAASKTSVVDIVGVGPVGAAMIVGYTGDVGRFTDRHHFASYNGTAPIEVSSGGRVVHRLSRRGNRQLNHAMHLAALSQIRYPDKPGRIYYDRKIAEGKTHKEAFRALKRRISDAVYRQLIADSKATK